MPRTFLSQYLRNLNNNLRFDGEEGMKYFTIKHADQKGCYIFKDELIDKMIRSKMKFLWNILYNTEVWIFCKFNHMNEENMDK